MRAAIFVVDDNIMLARATAALLRGRGHDVLIETDGTKALRILLGPQEFDVIFLDLLMPGEHNGSDIYKACKKDAPMRCKRIVFYTGLDYLVPKWIHDEGVLVISKGGSETVDMLVRTVLHYAELDSPRGPKETRVMPPKPPPSQSHPEIPELYDDDLEVTTGVIELATKAPGIPKEVLTELRIRHLHSSHAIIKKDVVDVKADVGAIKTDVAATKVDVGTLKTDITSTIKTSAFWLGVIVTLGGLGAWLVEHVAMKK